MNRATRKAAAVLAVAVFVVSHLFLTPPVQAGLDLQTKAGVIWYVSQSGDNTDGLSWATAYIDLQSALTSAESGDQIWVAEGVYTPGTLRSDSFNLIPGAAMYGGFSGIESLLEERNWASHPTILSGDIDGDDTNDDGNFIAESSEDIVGNNSYHVIYADGTTGTTITTTTILDGFTITAGFANRGDIWGDMGGGMFCDGHSAENECSPNLVNITFSGNFASYQGGALLNYGFSGKSSPSLENATFSGNSTNYQGGALLNYGYSGESSPRLINVTFSGNTANAGGAIYNTGINGASNVVLINVILWGNTATNGSQIFNNNANPTLTTCLIEDGLDSGITNGAGSTVTDGGGNLDSDPLFVDAAKGDLHLQLGSPAIDKGTNAAVTSATDLDANPRFIDGDWDDTATVDIGAFEQQIICPTGPVIYVDKDAAGLFDGNSWETAFEKLSAGLNAAEYCSGIDQIWVAEGVYTPGELKTNSFNLVPGTALYGGFNGTETTLEEREWTTHLTILSGDIGGDDINDDGNFVAETSDDIVGENSYHVVYADGTTGTPITTTTVLDGFTITAGKARLGQYLKGGGMYCDGRSNGNECSPSLKNISFIGNMTAYGGAIYNDGNGGISSPTLVNVTFSGNTAHKGGAIYNNGSGGISSPSLVNVIFIGNTTDSIGGAMYNAGMNSGISSPNLKNVIFIGNTSTLGGGAMYNDGTEGNSSPDLENVKFSGNSATFGGAIYNLGVSGISSPNLVNVTFFENHAGGTGGALLNIGVDSGICSPYLVNVILWGNTADNVGSQMGNNRAHPTITTSLIEGGLSGGIYNWDNSSVVDGGGNLEADPLFVDAANGDLRLQEGSPAIDSGTNAAVTVLTDLDGNLRIFDGNGDNTPIVDIGVYEFHNTAKFIYLPLVTQ